MRLSILMPTHERPDTLALAIDSVRRQSFTDWELLVCGDGCGEETDRVVRSAMEIDPRVRWFPLPKAPGFGYANRNIVLAEARGECIGFAAHDNLVMPDHWLHLMRAMEEPSFMIAASSAAWVDDQGRVVPAIFPLRDPAIRKGFIATTANRLPANAFVYRASLHSEIGMWDATLEKRGDLDLWSRILRHSGEDAFHVSSRIGFLHFRGLWKNAAAINDPQDEGIWKTLFAEPDRLPAALRQTVPDGVLPQCHFHSLLHGEKGDCWVEELRAACADAIGIFAAEAEARWLAAEKALRKLEKKAARDREALAALKSSAKQRPRRKWWRFFC
jgi:glycosyltransferase involved in cell wall biosynthesis